MSGRPAEISVAKDVGNPLHEYFDRLQRAMPGFNQLFVDLHRRRTAGEPRVPVTAGSSSELGRTDQYFSKYMGREYGPDEDPREVLTMAMQGVFHPIWGRDYLPAIVRDDPEMVDHVLGVLFRYNPRMAVHTIMLPDRLRGRELRSIVWDDLAGTVEGDHHDIGYIRRMFDEPKPVTVGDPGRIWGLSDPAHNPTEFLVLLSIVYWPVLIDPLRSTLPAVFDGLVLPLGGPGEVLYDRDVDGNLVNLSATA